MLTQRQENFTLNLYKGQTEHDAWGNAGYSTNYSKEVLYVNACRLANSTKVKLRLNELRSQEATPAIADVQERKEKLTEVIRFELPDKVTAKERVMATDTINKMDRIYTEKEPGRDIIQTFVFILPDGTKVTPKELKDSQRALEGNNGQSVTKEAD